MVSGAIREGAPLLDGSAALVAAIERAQAELPAVGDELDPRRRERLQHAAGDVLRALAWARRNAELGDAERLDRMASLELAGAAMLDRVAHALGGPLLRKLGHSGRLHGWAP